MLIWKIDVIRDGEHEEIFVPKGKLSLRRLHELLKLFAIRGLSSKHIAELFSQSRKASPPWLQIRKSDGDKRFECGDSINGATAQLVSMSKMPKEPEQTRRRKKVKLRKRTKA